MKRGFTLLEVLSIIVILGVLSVLLVPKVVDLVDASEEKAILDSAKQYVSAVNKYIVENNIDTSGTYNVSKANEGFAALNDVVDVSGKLPTGESVTIDDNYSVTSAVLIFNHFRVTYDGQDYSIEEIEE